MDIAQDNGYPSVNAMIPGIAAFEDEVGMNVIATCPYIRAPALIMYTHS
jgi:hypothetical protein